MRPADAARLCTGRAVLGAKQRLLEAWSFQLATRRRHPASPQVQSVCVFWQLWPLDCLSNFATSLPEPAGYRGKSKSSTLTRGCRASGVYRTIYAATLVVMLVAVSIRRPLQLLGALTLVLGTACLNDALARKLR